MAKTTTRSTKPAKTTRSKKVSSKKSSALLQTGADLRTAVLIVSLLINAFVVCLWVTLATTTEYDVALSQFFLGR